MIRKYRIDWKEFLNYPRKHDNNFRFQTERIQHKARAWFFTIRPCVVLRACLSPFFISSNNVLKNMNYICSHHLILNLILNWQILKFNAVQNQFAVCGISNGVAKIKIDTRFGLRLCDWHTAMRLWLMHERKKILGPSISE